jgi:alanine-synthesizing transaminase
VNIPPRMFSSRLPDDLASNRLARALDERHGSGRPFIDLTESNPTRAGFAYPPDLLTALGDTRGLTYAPRALGAEEARRAIAADYARRGAQVAPDRIVLTTSTSEAYSLLFKVLCDPGDDVLTPRPSYPLFEHLARLDAVVARTYDIECHAAWSIDVPGIEHAFTDRTRAVLVVSPNNPTGSFVKADELDRMAALCARRGAALIADEVFADYELSPDGASSRASMLTPRDALVFSLGGLSKSIGLPQVKLGWIAVAGPEPHVARALARLEVACDTYLSVSTPVQQAAAELLERGAAVRAQIQSRIVANYRALIASAASASSCRVLPSEGGWSAVLQVPSRGSEEDLVLDLLANADVLAHPGYFFDFVDFPGESFLVMSLLPPPSVFSDGVGRILSACGRPR